MEVNHVGAIVYDYLKVSGGAEQVSLGLADYHGADLFVGYKDPKVIGFTNGGSRARILPLTSFKKRDAWRESCALIRAFQKCRERLPPYDWIIYSGTFAPLAVKRRSRGVNLMYCHTLPRFMYDLRDYYWSKKSLYANLPRELLSQYLKPRYEKAVREMDVVISNSNNVADRMWRYLGIESRVIYPPCDVEGFNWFGQQDYYLSTARLEPYKRVDHIVRAFKKMPEQKLIVTSGGSQYEELRRIAGAAKNIVFTGWTDDQTKKKLYGGAIATLYVAIDEDFGISPVESMAAGKPVIGVNQGGLRETVVDGKTGVLIPGILSDEKIVDAVKDLTPAVASHMRLACESRADNFRAATFFRKIDRILNDV